MATDGSHPTPTESNYKSFCHQNGKEREKKEVGYYAEQFANCKSMLDH
jgi:hypothetical protein